MRYLGSIGVGGVLSEIGLLSTEKAKVPEMQLVERLCQRFEVEVHEVIEAIGDAVDSGLVQRTPDGFMVII